MQLYYCKTPHGNFGDDLNPWLWERIIPGFLNDDPNELFVGIGTLLNTSLPQKPLKVVFGSGFGYGKPPHIDESWNIYCVRGPLTARILGLDPALAVADPGILAAKAILPEAKKYLVSFMPHHQSMAAADWKRLCEQVGIHFIDPCGEVSEVLYEIARTETLIAEAMHGAIVADALRVPWVPVRLYSQINELKWTDWCESMELPCMFTKLTPIFQKQLKPLKALENRGKHLLWSVGIGKEKWERLQVRVSSQAAIDQVLDGLRRAGSSRSFLSEDRVHKRAVERLHEKLDAFKNDFSFCSS